jgi:nicotinamidase-related amidase
MAEVFVIVDMQVAYPAARTPELVARIETAARARASAGAHVVSIMFDGSGGSTLDLPAATTVLWKANCNGGDELYSWLVGAGFIGRDLHVTIAGVNLSICVYETARGLARRLCDEHSLCDNVSIALDLTGDWDRFRIKFV